MSEPDYLTVYLYAHEMARKDITKLKDENARLKAEVELWKLRSDNWQKFCQATKEGNQS